MILNDHELTFEMITNDQDFAYCDLRLRPGQVSTGACHTDRDFPLPQGRAKKMGQGAILHENTMAGIPRFVDRSFQPSIRVFAYPCREERQIPRSRGEEFGSHDWKSWSGVRERARVRDSRKNSFSVRPFILLSCARPRPSVHVRRLSDRWLSERESG